jgi:ketosteroid isomerase-like protein
VDHVRHGERTRGQDRLDRRERSTEQSIAQAERSPWRCFQATAKEFRFTPHSFAAGQDDVHLLVRWTFRSAITGRQASMAMHHYLRIRDGKIEHFRGSEDTVQTALVLTPDLTPTRNS